MNRWDMVIGKPAPPPLPKPKKKRSKSRAMLIWEEIYQKFSEFEKDGRRVGEIQIPKDSFEIILKSKRAITLKTPKGDIKALVVRDEHPGYRSIWGAKLYVSESVTSIECYQDLPF